MALRKNKSLLDQASDYIDQVRPQVESAVASALDAAEEFYETTARPALVDAKEKAGPALADAREKASVALADARAQAAPIVAQGAAKASELAAQASEKAAQAAEAAEAQVANLSGESNKKKGGGKLRKAAIFAVVAGVIAVVARKLQSSGKSDNWQSSYVPTPAPAPTSTDDAGAAGPDEALSDAAEEPHAVTTPDNPAEVVDLEAPVEDAAKKK
jgi:hypothetical protein